MAGCNEKIRLAFVLPHMRVGGIEVVVSNLLRHLDRSRFQPVLALKQVSGELLDTLPPDVMVHALNHGRTAMLMPALRRFLVNQKPDVVYVATNAMNLAVLATLRSMSRAGRPAVMISEHTSPSDYIAEMKWSAFRVKAMRILYPAADGIAAPIDEIGAELKRLLRQPDLPMMTLPNPIIELPTFLDERPLQHRPANGHAFAVRYVAAGRLVAAKAFDVLIQAFALVLRHAPASRLTIYGEGADRPVLGQLARDLDISDKVELPGNVANLIGHLRQHSIFVLSSRREGFGNVLIEAMAAGLPVVATNQAGPRAILEDGKVGLLVDSDRPEMMAEAMLRLATGYDLRRTYAEEGRRRCLDFEVGAATREFEWAVHEVSGVRSSRGVRPR